MLDESRKIGTFGHGFTYSGHPVAAAVALKTLEIYARERIVEAVARKAPQFQARLRGARRSIRWSARRAGSAWSARVELVADKAQQAVVRCRRPASAPRAVRFAEEEGLIVRFARGRRRLGLPAADHHAGGDRRAVRPARPRARPHARLGAARAAAGRHEPDKTKQRRARRPGAVAISNASDDLISCVPPAVAIAPRAD